MRDSPQWIAAKTAGDRAELAIAEWFREHGWQPFKTVGQAEFDLLLQCEVEVKRDLKAAETGNVAVETFYKGQPSGIMTSRATWWVIVVGNEALIAKTDTLRRFALAGDFREVAAGDNKQAVVRLIPVNQLKELKGVFVVAMPELAGSES